MALIAADNVQKHFRRGTHSVEAIRGVSLAIDEGEILCIMGRSGSGKTTLLSLLGLLDVPTGGSLSFRNRDTCSMSPRERTDLRRSSFGFMFQQFNLLPHLTAAENVALPLRYCGVPRGERLRRAASMLERVGLAHRKEFLSDELSGGEAQRVALARALINSPVVLCADEPTSELDTATGEEVMSLMTALHKEWGMTMIMVSHDHQVASCATRIVTMEDGMLHG